MKRILLILAALLLSGCDHAPIAGPPGSFPEALAVDDLQEIREERDRRDLEIQAAVIRIYEIEVFLPDGSVRRYESYKWPEYLQDDEAWSFDDIQSGRYIVLFRRPTSITVRRVEPQEQPE